MAKKKVVKKEKDLSGVEVSRERKGVVKGRIFDVVEKDGFVSQSIEVV